MSRWSRGPGGDHPRVGGEKNYRKEVENNGNGSPPRGRGKAHHRRHPGGVPGITPAWAGKSHSVRLTSARFRDHPRVGGEKWNCLFASASALGSPPRGRGKVYSGMQRVVLFRITPAWAGKSSHYSGSLFFSWDHPRVGGEKFVQSSLIGHFRGSPPRGRGKVCVPAWRTVSAGITPAWAGKRA